VWSALASAENREDFVSPSRLGGERGGIRDGAEGGVVVRVLAVLAVVGVLAACSGGDDGAGATGAGASATSVTSPAPATEDIDAMVDVGGHKLHLFCRGAGSEGSPTVIYLHGLSHVQDGGEASGASAASLPQVLGAKYRFCGYDRANVGSSEDVPGPLTGKSSAQDLERLLAAAEIEPPYLLLGASFGGLVAETYAASHPDGVAGMLLLDAGFPDELDMEPLFPKSERLNHDKTGDSGWAETHEQMDELAAYEDAHALIGKEPAIPMTYLLAEPPSYSGGPAKYEMAFPRYLDKFAARYSPGVVRKVDSDHYMEAAVPDRILAEVDKLVAR
jgi:pimeloyl-ACP methyl ester carboxylesterase